MKRPVRCFLCGKQMFYSSDPRHEPERQFRESGSLKESYLHLRCLQQARKIIRKLIS